jgi:hypothetical protein
MTRFHLKQPRPTKTWFWWLRLRRWQTRNDGVSIIIRIFVAVVMTSSRANLWISKKKMALSLSLSLVNWFWRCWVKNKELKKKRKLNGIEKDYREANVKCIWIGNQKVTCLFKFGLKFKKTNFECSNTTFETF